MLSIGSDPGNEPDWQRTVLRARLRMLKLQLRRYFQVPSLTICRYSTYACHVVMWSIHTELLFYIAMSNLQISLIFPRIIFQWNINVRVSEGNSPRALSNGACNVSVDKIVTQPRPPKLSSQKINTNKNEASSGSAEPICTVKASVDSSFSELPSAFFPVSVLLARAEIFSIYWRPLEVGYR